MKHKIALHSLLIILTFLFALYGKGLFNSLLDISISSDIGRIIYSYAWWVVPVIIVIGLLYGIKNVLMELGLEKGFLFGFGFAVVTVSPMLISSAILGEMNTETGISKLLHKTVFAGFMEELLFRGFLFGILFRKLNWGFIPAAMLGAVIFGISHLYQGETFGQALGVFLVTFVGAGWFAWLYIEWDENLWVPIFLHILMNLSWTLFEVSSNALGDSTTNIFRIITIALTVLLTIVYNKKRGRFSINGQNLIWNNVK